MQISLENWAGLVQVKWIWASVTITWAWAYETHKKKEEMRIILHEPSSKGSNLSAPDTYIKSIYACHVFKFIVHFTSLNHIII